MKSIILLFAIIFYSQINQASDCVSQADADKFFANYSLLFFNDSKQEWDKETSIPLCTEDDFSNSLLQGLAFLGKVQATSSKTKNTDSVVSQEGAENYFRKRISQLLIETEKHSRACSNEGVVAYVSDIEGPKMHICPEEFSGYSPLMASYILLHEARHMDGYDHVFCSQGPLKEQDEAEDNYYGSCDESFELQGSYGVGAGYLLEVYRTSADPVIKQEARSNAVIDLIERFNKLPLKMKTGVLIQSDLGQLSFYDGLTKNKIMNVPDTVQTVTLRYGLPTLFDINGEVSTYLFSKKLSHTESQFAAYYLNDFSAAQRGDTLDVYYSSEYSCFLFKSKIFCEDDEDTQFEMSFENIKPIQFVKSSNSNLIQINTLYLTAADGYLYSLPSTMPELQKISNERQLNKTTNKLNVLSLSTGSDRDVLSINFSGELLKFNHKRNLWSPVPEYQGQKSKKILSPYVWSKKIEDL